MIDLIKKLKIEPQNRDMWLDLAIDWKIIGDYQVSVEILNYIVILWPNDYVPFNNLADLYQFYIKNYQLAEKNWLKVIDLNPGYTDAYQNLYYLYEQNQGEALKILLLGLKNNPKNTGFMILIARHYLSVGDKDSAIRYFNMAMAEAKAMKNDKLEKLLTEEMSEI